MTPEPATPLPRVLVSGIDTLEIFSRLPVVVEWQERLRDAHHWAADGGRPVDLEVAGHVFKVAPGRSRIAPYMLTSAALTLHVNPQPPRGFPAVSAELRSAFLWQHGAAGAVDRARHLLATFSGFAQVEPAITRVDLAVDFQGWTDGAREGFEIEDARRFRCRARQVDTHSVSGDCTGFSFGAGGEVLARLYNKSTEIRTKSPEKVWFYKVWAESPAYQADVDVWRLEFQLRRRGFRSFLRDGEGHVQSTPSPMLREAGVGQLDGWRDLQAAAGALWRYLSGRWLRVPGRRTNRHKRALDPRWEVLHRDGYAGKEWNGYAGDLTRSGRSALIRRDDRAFAGTLARTMGAALLDDPEACGDELILGAVRRAEAALAAKGTDLDTRAQERAEAHRAEVAAIMDGRRAFYASRPDPLGLPPGPPAAPAARERCPLCGGRGSRLVDEESRVCARCDGWGTVDSAAIDQAERPPELHVAAEPQQRALALPWGQRGTGA